MGYETARRLKNDQNDLRKSPTPAATASKMMKKIRQKLGHHTPHSLYAVTREIITAVISAQNQ